MIDECTEPISPARTGVSLDSSLDTDREEMCWNSSHEELIQTWSRDARNRAESHAKAAKKFKRMFYWLGIPPSLLPIVLSGVSDFIHPRYAYATTIILVLSGILSGINTFINPSKKCENHFEFEARFLEFVVDIDVEMSKGKRFRIPADVCLERVSSNYNSLSAAAPDV